MVMDAGASTRVQDSRGMEFHLLPPSLEQFPIIDQGPTVPHTGLGLGLPPLSFNKLTTHHSQHCGCALIHLLFMLNS